MRELRAFAKRGGHKVAAFIKETALAPQVRSHIVAGGRVTGLIALAGIELGEL